MRTCQFCGTVVDQDVTTCPVCGSDPDIVLANPRTWTQRRQPASGASMVDEDGQPTNRRFNAARRCDRDVSELLGLAKGMLADGIINDAEAQYLYAWGENHPDALTQWPVSRIFSRVKHHFADGRITAAERADLQELLGALVGGTASVLLGYEGATTLPLDTPPPLLAYGPDEVYVFTGKFAYGPRAVCQREVVERGGACEDNITRRTSFLVIGTFGSEDWAHTSYGRKIQRAVDLRTSGFALRIVGEDHWAATLNLSA